MENIRFWLAVNEFRESAGLQGSNLVEDENALTERRKSEILQSQSRKTTKRNSFFSSNSDSNSEKMIVQEIEDGTITTTVETLTTAKSMATNAMVAATTTTTGSRTDKEPTDHAPDPTKNKQPAISTLVSFADSPLPGTDKTEKVSKQILLESAKQIYTDYIKPGSEMQINVPNKMSKVSQCRGKEGNEVFASSAKPPNA